MSISWLGLSGLMLVLLASPVMYAAIWSRPDRAGRAMKVLAMMLRSSTVASTEPTPQDDDPKR